MSRYVCEYGSHELGDIEIETMCAECDHEDVEHVSAVFSGWLVIDTALGFERPVAMTLDADTAEKLVRLLNKDVS